MQIKSINSKEFKKYGYAVEGYDWGSLVETLEKVSEKPADSVIYVPGDPALEALPVAGEIRDRLYGGMAVEIGYCNGHNRSLNCLEYHRGSEINVAADDVILLLAPLDKVENHKLDTCEVEAFLLPAGKAVLLYETALHYAPCTADGKDGFRVAIILPKGTNLDKPAIKEQNCEDKLLWAANKWLLAHPDSGEAKAGAWVGLTGENIIL